VSALITSSFRLVVSRRRCDGCGRDNSSLGSAGMAELIAVLYFIHGHGAAKPIVRRLLDALPPGSYLVATHARSDFGTPEQQALYQGQRGGIRPCS
jgi:hypothetical protein